MRRPYPAHRSPGAPGIRSIDPARGRRRQAVFDDPVTAERAQSHQRWLRIQQLEAEAERDAQTIKYLSDHCAAWRRATGCQSPEQAAVIRQQISDAAKKLVDGNGL